MIACSKLDRLLAAVGPLDLELVRRGEPADALHDRHLALLGEAGQPAGQALDHAVLPAAQLVEVDLGRGEGEAVRGHLLAPRRSPWRRAAAPWTGCSRRSGRPRRASASARPARPSCRDRRRGTRRCSRRARRPAPAPRPGSRPCRRAGRAWPSAGAAGAAWPAPAAAGLQLQDQAALGDPVADLDRARPRTVPAAGAGTSMVALSVSRVSSGSSALTSSPGRDMHLDHRDVLEVADVGDLDLDRLVDARPPSRSPRARPSRCGRLLDPLLWRDRGGALGLQQRGSARPRTPGRRP